MNENFKELISLLQISDIRIMEQHSKVFEYYNLNDGSEIRINTEQKIPSEDPVINDNDILIRPKYEIKFINEEKSFFECEFYFCIVFNTENPSRVKELLSMNDIADIFYSKQINRTLWPILRSELLATCNRHSIQPVTLPWIK